MASAHLMVDGYGNIYAPLLPLLIPKLSLSLAAAGTLTMLYQIAASVSQVGFGHLADRWRPRLLVMVGPVVAVACSASSASRRRLPMLAAILSSAASARAAFHPPAAALAHRLGGEPSRAGDVRAHHRRHARVSRSGRCCSPPPPSTSGSHGRRCSRSPGCWSIALLPDARAADRRCTRDGAAASARFGPTRGPLGLLYLIVVLRTLTSLSFATFVPVMLTRRGVSVGQAGAVVAIYLFASGARRLPRRAGRGSLRSAPRDRVVAGAGDAVPARRAAAVGLAVRRHPRHRRLLPAVDAAGQRRLRSVARAGQRRDRIVADDGLRVGHGRIQRAVCRR